MIIRIIAIAIKAIPTMSDVSISIAMALFIALRKFKVPTNNSTNFLYKYAFISIFSNNRKTPKPNKIIAQNTQK